MPIPVANIMEIHELVRYSGSSASPPRGICPNRDMAMKMTNTTNRLAETTKSQPKLRMVPSRAADETRLRLWVPRKPQATNPMVRILATPKTTLSIPSRGWGDWRVRELRNRSIMCRWRRWAETGEVSKAAVAVSEPAACAGEVCDAVVSGLEADVLGGSVLISEYSSSTWQHCAAQGHRARYQVVMEHSWGPGSPPRRQAPKS